MTGCVQLGGQAEFGSYELVVNEPGRCTLTIQHGKQTASPEVFSYNEATRYNLVLETKDGTLSLRRE